MREEVHDEIKKKESQKLKAEISRSESMSRIFRHMAISTHKDVKISRAGTTFTFCFSRQKSPISWFHIFLPRAYVREGCHISCQRSILIF